jgi:hypothetical protein
MLYRIGFRKCSHSLDVFTYPKYIYLEFCVTWDSIVALFQIKAIEDGNINPCIQSLLAVFPYEKIFAYATVSVSG